MYEIFRKTPGRKVSSYKNKFGSLTSYDVTVFDNSVGQCMLLQTTLFENKSSYK